jgi:acyl carrier protein
MDRIEERLRRYIGVELAPNATTAALADDAPLIEGGVIDSMGIFELVSFVEREFGVQIADEELVLDNFRTIGTIARLIDSKAGG